MYDPNGQAWEVRGLYVGDDAGLPSELGVNRMRMIEPAARKTARGRRRTVSSTPRQSAVIMNAVSSVTLEPL